MMEITREMTEAFQRGSGYGGDISQPDVDRGLRAALNALEPEQLMEMLHDFGVPATEYAAYLAACRAGDQ